MAGPVNHMCTLLLTYLPALWETLREILMEVMGGLETVKNFLMLSEETKMLLTEVLGGLKYGFYHHLGLAAANPLNCHAKQKY